jgi:hypothetical protein
MFSLTEMGAEARRMVKEHTEMVFRDLYPYLSRLINKMIKKMSHEKETFYIPYGLSEEKGDDYAINYSSVYILQEGKKWCRIKTKDFLSKVMFHEAYKQKVVDFYATKELMKILESLCKKYEIPIEM